MQSIYAFQQCRVSDFHLAVNRIHAYFSPDLNSMERQDREQLNKNKLEGEQIFTAQYAKGTIAFDDGTDTEIKKAVNEALLFYQNALNKDKNHLRKMMVAETEKIDDRYLLLLALLPELAHQEKLWLDKKVKNSQNVGSNLTNNRVLQLLQHNEPFYNTLNNKKINWSNHQDDLRQWYREIIRKDEQYLAYIDLAAPTFADDRDWLNHLIKQIVFKHEVTIKFLEEHIFNWAEDKEVIKNMVVKTVKGIEEGQPQSLQLMKLSSNWEDDKIFFENLFTYTLDHDGEFEHMITTKAKNWDSERIATLDKIILKMALSEMMNFPSIPVKVTINEYIEISKKYSTPKSRQFINGILDVLAEELKKSGMIRKSGRGLLDNK